MRLYVLTKKKAPYDNDQVIHGVVSDEATAKRWVDWTGGDYVEVDTEDPISSQKPLSPNSEINRQRKLVQDSTLQGVTPIKEADLG